MRNITDVHLKACYQEKIYIESQKQRKNDTFFLLFRFIKSEKKRPIFDITNESTQNNGFEQN